MKKLNLIIGLLTCCIVSFSQPNWRTTNYNIAEVGGGVDVSWAGINETSMASYQIERSTNGNVFSVIGELAARNLNGTTPYVFRDGTPVEGVNFYRIRSINSVGGVLLSDIFKVERRYGRSEVKVYPNPVTTGVVRLQMNNVPSGRYSVMIYNTAGRQLYNQSMVLSEGSATQMINLPATINKGNYILHVTNGVSRVNTNLVVN